MTIPQLLGKTVTELEAMSDEELLGYLRPHIQAVQAIRPSKVSGVIDVSGQVDKAAKKKESVDDFIARMTKMMTAKMESMSW